MKRQLYMGGGIMDAVPREQYGLGSVFKGVTNAVKKVAGGVKDIVSSDVGKMAFLAAGAYYTGGALGGTGGFNNFATLGSVLKNKAAGMVPELLKGKAGTALGITALGGLFGGAMAGKSEEEVEALTRDVPALKSYLTQYYTNLNQKAKPEEIEQFVNSQIAEYNEGRGGYAMGGRMQYSDGTMSPDEYFSGKEKYMKQKQMEDMIREYEKYMRDRNMKRDEVDMGGRMQYAMGSNNEVDLQEMLNAEPKLDTSKMPRSPKFDSPLAIPDDVLKKLIEYLRRNKAEVTAEQLAMDLFGKTIERLTGEQREMLIMMLARSQAQDGGIMNRINYALGGEDTASQNAMQAAGIEGLPMRQNPKGVQELDLRDNGGFIPPVGIKVKEDDIPAMLSNNEFVFTADAVRGMGDGDVELGAQRMYDQMKTLEEGGRV